jgi:cytidyltransferase-like protein
MHVIDIFEATQRRVVALYPGRFQPFHRGHRAVFDYLSKTFGAENTFIATSDKVNPPKSPFNFSEKQRMMALTGIDTSRVVQTAEPYRANEIVDSLDKENTVLIFAVSQKDMAEDPRFAKWTKKDGSPSYFQPAPKDLSQAAPLSQHGYIYVVPTFPFKIQGQDVESATAIRALFSQSDEAQKKALVKELFGAYDEEVYNIMANKVTEGWKSRLAGAALAGAAALGGAPAQADVNLGTVFTAGRAINNARQITAHDVKNEIGNEITNIARGNRNHSHVLGMGKTAPTPLRAMEMGKDLSSTKDAALKQLQRRSGQEIDPNRVRYDVDEVKPGVFRVVAITEEAAGVGVVASKKQAKDPRYSMSLTKDVRPGQVNKSLRAFRLAENAEELNVGDNVIITGDVEFKGTTGVIDDFGRDKRFVIVNLYNHGKHSFHSSDVEHNDYADSDEEQSYHYDRDPHARDWDVDESLYQYDKADPFNSEFAPDVGMGRMTLRAWKQSLIRRVRQLSTELDQAGQHMDSAAMWDSIYKKMKALNLDPIAQEIELAHNELEKIRKQGGTRSRAFKQLGEQIVMLQRLAKDRK